MPLFPTISVQTCPLCGSRDDLVESHILPRFVFAWFRKTSPTGHVRLGVAPNVRIQDGVKQPLLCAACDQRIGAWEKVTAEELFHPYHENSGAIIKHESWLAKFCASVCWRVLYLHRGLGLKHFSESQLVLVDKALSVWKDFMLDRCEHPGANELHLLPFDTLASGDYSDLPPNINRYLARAVDMDVVCNKTSAFTYAKLCKLVIVGFIQMPYANRWKGTRVVIRRGQVQPRHYALPGEFLTYINGQARKMAKLMSGISAKQREKIDASFKANLYKAAQSEGMRAFEADLEIFGQAAFDLEKTDEKS